MTLDTVKQLLVRAIIQPVANQRGTPWHPHYVPADQCKYKLTMMSTTGHKPVMTLNLITQFNQYISKGN